MSRLKLAVAAALRAKRAWERLTPEQRRKLLEAAKTHGPVVARKAAAAARTQGPMVARRLADALERARRR